VDDNIGNIHVLTMHQALICLSLSPIMAQEFINNGITSTDELRTLDSEDPDHLTK
jgi:hypothetical protein